MKKYLFMYTPFGGHVLEYFMHIYKYALLDRENLYYFIFSQDFKRYIDNEHVISKDNTIIQYLVDEEYETLRHSSRFIQSYYLNKLLNDKIHVKAFSSGAMTNVILSYQRVRRDICATISATLTVPPALKSSAFRIF